MLRSDSDLLTNEYAGQLASVLPLSTTTAILSRFRALVKVFQAPSGRQVIYKELRLVEQHVEEARLKLREAEVTAEQVKLALEAIGVGDGAVREMRASPDPLDPSRRRDTRAPPQDDRDLVLRASSGRAGEETGLPSLRVTDRRPMPVILRRRGLARHLEGSKGSERNLSVSRANGTGNHARKGSIEAASFRIEDL